MIKKNFPTPGFWDNNDTVELLKESLKCFNLSITTTDTVLGLLASLDIEGFMKLNQAKGGRNDKPYLILVESAEKIFLLSDQIFSSCIMKFIRSCCPGPVTFIVRAAKGLPPCAVSKSGTIALRCPNHQGLRTLLHFFNGLFSTSANRSGQPIPQTIEQIDPILLEEVDYLVVDTQQSLHTLSSTILDLTDSENDNITVVREGAYPLKELENLYGKKFNQ